MNGQLANKLIPFLVFYSKLLDYDLASHLFSWSPIPFAASFLGRSPKSLRLHHVSEG